MCVKDVQYTEIINQTGEDYKRHSGGHWQQGGTIVISSLWSDWFSMTQLRKHKYRGSIWRPSADSSVSFI